MGTNKSKTTRTYKIGELTPAQSAKNARLGKGPAVKIIGTLAERTAGVNHFEPYGTKFQREQQAAYRQGSAAFDAAHNISVARFSDTRASNSATTITAPIKTGASQAAHMSNHGLVPGTEGTGNVPTSPGKHRAGPA